MNIPRNPFVRGYYNVEIQRIVVINYDNDYPPTHLPLHLSQCHLSDEQIIHHACTFSDDFVLITEGQDVAPAIEALCAGISIVQNVVYGICSDDGEKIVHMGDAYSLVSAQAVAHHLMFATGFYSRCWEISSAHLPAEAMRYLNELIDSLVPWGLLFEVFRIPSSPALGIKLIATPWTDKNLRDVENITAEQLRQEHLDNGVPVVLINLLHQAALADVRILIFDADAPTLEGLKLYDDDQQ